jgi:hypothetical protein
MYTKIVFQRINFHLPNFLLLLPSQHNGGLAQLARALAWHARGHRFDSDILHIDNQALTGFCRCFFALKTQK